MKLLRHSCVGLAIVLGFFTIIASNPCPCPELYVDSDGDGFGSQVVCTDELVCVADNTDCDDRVDGADGISGNEDDGANINPDVIEICDGIDNNCDGDTDCRGSACFSDPACAIACNNVVIHSAETVTGTLSTPTQVDLYTFCGIAGQTVLISMSRVSGTVNPYIRLYDPDGILEATSVGDYDYHEIAGHKLLMSGEYTIVVSDRKGNNIGDYILSFNTIT